MPIRLIDRNALVRIPSGDVTLCVKSLNEGDIEMIAASFDKLRTHDARADFLAQYVVKIEGMDIPKGWTNSQVFKNLEKGGLEEVLYAVLSCGSLSPDERKNLLCSLGLPSLQSQLASAGSAKDVTINDTVA